MAQTLLRDTCTLLRCKIRRSVCLLAPPLKAHNSESVVPYDVIMKTKAPDIVHSIRERPMSSEKKRWPVISARIVGDACAARECDRRRSE